MAPSTPRRPIRLYGTLLSGHCHRVQLFLSLLGLPFEYVAVDLASGENRQPAFLAINPLGEVPVIDDDGFVLADSNAILVYLARQYADESWYPQDPRRAAAVQRWLSLAAGKIAYGPCAARLRKVFDLPHNLEIAQAIAIKLFDVLEPELRDQPFATGAAPTIADVAGYAYIAHAPEGGLSLEPYPNIRAWLRRIEALPGFVRMRASPPRTRA